MNKTRSILLGTVSLIALGGTALAADLPRKAPPVAPIAYPPPANWGGCYLGGTVGAQHHRQTGGFINGDESDAFDVFQGGKTGGIYGGYVGCQWQNRSFVYGLEGDFSGLSGTGFTQPG